MVMLKTKCSDLFNNSIIDKCLSRHILRNLKCKYCITYICCKPLSFHRTLCATATYLKLEIMLLLTQIQSVYWTVLIPQLQNFIHNCSLCVELHARKPCTIFLPQMRESNIVL